MDIVSGVGKGCTINPLAYHELLAQHAVICVSYGRHDSVFAAPGGLAWGLKGKWVQLPLLMGVFNGEGLGRFTFCLPIASVIGFVDTVVDALKA